MVSKFDTEFFNVLNVIKIKWTINVKVNTKKKSFECEIVRSCKNCVKKITQIKYYSTKSNKLRRLPENEFGYMLPHYKKGSDQIEAILYLDIRCNLKPGCLI